MVASPGGASKRIRLRTTKPAHMQCLACVRRARARLRAEEDVVVVEVAQEGGTIDIGMGY